MMPLEECLREGHKMWSWLAENHFREKYQYPKDDNIQYTNNCSCCQYVEDNYPNTIPSGKGECALVCPMKELWPGGCVMPNSPYRKWLDGYFKGDRISYAEQIRDAFKEKLDKLNKDL